MEEEDYWSKSDVQKFSFDEDDDRVCVCCVCHCHCHSNKSNIKTLINVFAGLYVTDPQRPQTDHRRQCVRDEL